MAKKQRSSDSDAPASTCVSWDMGSKAALIDFLLEHKLETGDGINLKVPTFKKAAIHLIPFNLKGGAKSAASCKNKWARVCTLYDFVIMLTGSDERYISCCARADGTVGNYMD